MQKLLRKKTVMLGKKSRKDMAKWSIFFRLFGSVIILVRKIVFSYQLTLSILFCFVFSPGEMLLLNQIF